MRFTILVLLLSCNNRSEQPAAEAPPVTTPGKTGTASITGSVTFKGSPPAPPSFTPSSDCARIASAARPLVVSKSGGVAEAFVYVKDGLPPGRYPVPSEPMRLDQKGCQYKPRVFGARVDQAIVLANSDPILHNVHGPNFNVPLPNVGAQVTRKFTKSEVMARVSCDVHPWMRAYAGVLLHPFFAVTDEDGKFKIKDLPAGTYTLEVWQEKLGKKTQPVTVADGASATVSFDF